MGTDILIGMADQLYPVRDVSGSSWVIDVNGQLKTLTAKDSPFRIKVTSALKLTEISASIDNLKSGRSQLPENSPEARRASAMSRSAATYEDYQMANDQALASQAGTIAAGQVMISTNPVPVGAPRAAASAFVNSQVQNFLGSAQQGVAAAAAGPGNYLDLEAAGRKSEAFDAMDAEFEVSSPRPLTNPFVVTVTRFHPKDRKPGLVKIHVYARALNPIDSRPTRIHLIEGGFPDDFELIEYRIHLYNLGEEVATNISPKRVELTRDEAFEYIKMEYIGAHKGETLASAPMMGNLPADLPKRLATGEYGGTYYVRVSKEGMAIDPYYDSACTKKVVDPYLRSVISNIRFKPALGEGSPVDGIAELKLGQLTI